MALGDEGWNNNSNVYEYDVSYQRKFNCWQLQQSWRQRFMPIEDGKGTCAGITVQANTNFAKFLDDHIEVPDQR